VQDDEDLRLTLHHEPYGVVGAIVPWNYPVVLAVGKIAPALLTGNCVIAKPSPFTPYSLLKLAEIIKPAFPDSVLQVLNGDDTLGPRICEHEGIQKISFTGSTDTGKKIMATASKTLKNVTLELSGNSASIICPDVNVDVVAPQVAVGSFFNSGQLCVASKRIYVHSDIYDEFLDKFVSAVRSWGVGLPGVDKEIMLGPLQNEMQYSKVKSLYEETASGGHTFALGADQIFQDSNFLVQPTIIREPAENANVVQVEAFGKKLY
jgi:acyl-CoA reductase-like NAD-dependent aldehyde dehydrogenase